MVVTALGVILSPVIVYLTAPGFTSDPAKFQLTVDLLRIVFPYIFFISLVSLAGGILNTFSRFTVPALTPALLNLSFIAFALWVAPYCDPPVMALANAHGAKFICVSDGVRDALLREGADPRRCLTVHNGIDCGQLCTLIKCGFNNQTTFHQLIIAKSALY